MWFAYTPAARVASSPSRPVFRAFNDCDKSSDGQFAPRILLTVSMQGRLVRRFAGLPRTRVECVCVEAGVDHLCLLLPGGVTATRGLRSLSTTLSDRLQHRLHAALRRSAALMTLGNDLPRSPQTRRREVFPTTSARWSAAPPRPFKNGAFI